MVYLLQSYNHAHKHTYVLLLPTAVTLNSLSKQQNFLFMPETLQPQHRTYSITHLISCFLILALICWSLHNRSISYSSGFAKLFMQKPKLAVVKICLSEHSNAEILDEVQQLNTWWNEKNTPETEVLCAVQDNRLQ